jgi:hypothetical protein
MIDQIADINIRRLHDRDGEAVRRLAQLDSAHVPRGALVGAEVEGRLIAAVAIGGEGAIADPFSRTDEIQALLELRAAQLRRRPKGRPRGLRLRARRAAGGLAGSPPGAGGRLIELPR